MVPLVPGTWYQVSLLPSPSSSHVVSCCVHGIYTVRMDRVYSVPLLIVAQGIVLDIRYLPASVLEHGVQHDRSSRFESRKIDIIFQYRGQRMIRSA